MSGRKNTLEPVSLVTSGDMSGNITSRSQNVQFLDFVSVQIDITGSPVGSLDVQVSQNNSTWVSLPLSPTPDVSKTPIVIEITEEICPYIRIVYTATSGSGTMTALITARQN